MACPSRNPVSYNSEIHLGFVYYSPTAPHPTSVTITSPWSLMEASSPSLYLCSYLPINSLPHPYVPQSLPAAYIVLRISPIQINKSNEIQCLLWPARPGMI